MLPKYYHEGRVPKKRGQDERSPEPTERDQRGRARELYNDYDDSREHDSTRRPKTRGGSAYSPPPQHRSVSEYARVGGDYLNRDAHKRPRASPETSNSQSISDPNGRDQLSEQDLRGRSLSRAGLASLDRQLKGLKAQKLEHPPTTISPGDHSPIQPSIPQPSLLSVHYCYEHPEKSLDPEYALLSGILDKSPTNWTTYGSVNHKNSAGKRWEQKKAEDYKAVTKADVAQRYCGKLKTARQSYGKKLADKVAKAHGGLQKRSDELHEDNHTDNSYYILIKPKLAVPEHDFDSLRVRQLLVGVVLEHAESITRLPRRKTQAVDTCKKACDIYVEHLPKVCDHIYRETVDAIKKAIAHELTKRCIPFYKSQNPGRVFEWG
ncbi:hypothetical protein EJ03DRAFT_350376 [Teratosphaeria nubilosa]|uniref:Uncharacterized protein n=1 Tax=Teratosphaeria nubilosa TaxID=161662 RepID=A0A6G1LD30_9PEZI|nr:hypothetical protein EJ03DRAFT_350376 [Teratosphaeria nubilosa]